MAQENHGLPPEVHIDHWNEATNIYMLVVCVSLWFLYYLRRNGVRVMHIFTRRENAPVQGGPDVHKDSMKRVRLHQQLEHYTKVRKWDLEEQRIEME